MICHCSATTFAHLDATIVLSKQGFKSNLRSSRVLMASMAALKGYNMVTYAPLKKKHPTLP
ncbi:hypothetical protein HanRHA438_Chr05g0238181 [Helianthus annuus]|uniref:Uncharacterized protein n=1 Tax=Helianthus annuus TaxID=4232 RepID=A0A251US89_HELAN|nr:hypothetical protein HanXRQr2_Chr05g0229121 [Helianthus annuus]KAJ0585576.1 hypothetical protein HanHA89_Chr05g0202311 [Helianthus annuus]KAJ0647507.1 hypothetical protein HanLR1_Chr15g0562591 [Helianthus annuus]KAJ0920153.1 hypothetical protein HanRHA438_Chr05g0238181 [Helianthus annuus]